MGPLVFIIASILGWGVGSFLYKGATNSNVHPVMISSIALIFYIVLMPLMWMFIKFDSSITAIGLAYTLAGSLCMCIGTLGFSYALQSGAPVGQTTFLIALYPTLTLMLSMIFLGETLNIRKIIGMCLALISFMILSLK